MTLASIYEGVYVLGENGLVISKTAYSRIEILEMEVNLVVVSLIFYLILSIWVDTLNWNSRNGAHMTKKITTFASMWSSKIKKLAILMKDVNDFDNISIWSDTQNWNQHLCSCEGYKWEL